MFSKKPSDQFQRSWVAAGVTVAGLVYGGIKSANAKKDEKAALGKIQPYKTPQEVFDIVEATKNNAQSGFDSQTLNFLTNQTDNAFAGSLGVIQRLGGDPNAMSAIFGQKVDAIKGIEAQSTQMKMANFSAYINSLNMAASNDAAEQKSQQDLLKNELQRIAQEKAFATQQITSSLNTGISAYSNYKMAQLYAPKTTI